MLNSQGVITLEEELDEDYEPTEEEIKEYAEWLGMDLEKDEDLFWIAREGLKAPLPDSWKPCQTAEGDIFYFNFSTGDSKWDHPCDEHYKKLFEEEKKKKAEGATGGEEQATGAAEDKVNPKDKKSTPSSAEGKEKSKEKKKDSKTSSSSSSNSQKKKKLTFTDIKTITTGKITDQPAKSKSLSFSAEMQSSTSAAVTQEKKQVGFSPASSSSAPPLPLAKSAPPSSSSFPSGFPKTVSPTASSDRSSKSRQGQMEREKGAPEREPVRVSAKESEESLTRAVNKMKKANDWLAEKQQPPSVLPVSSSLPPSLSLPKEKESHSPTDLPARSSAPVISPSRREKEKGEKFRETPKENQEKEDMQAETPPSEMDAISRMLARIKKEKEEELRKTKSGGGAKGVPITDSQNAPKEGDATATPPGRRGAEDTQSAEAKEKDMDASLPSLSSSSDDGSRSKTTHSKDPSTKRTSTEDPSPKQAQSTTPPHTDDSKQKEMASALDSLKAKLAKEMEQAEEAAKKEAENGDVDDLSSHKTKRLVEIKREKDAEITRETPLYRDHCTKKIGKELESRRPAFEQAARKSLKEKVEKEVESSEKYNQMEEEERQKALQSIQAEVRAKVAGGAEDEREKKKNEMKESIEKDIEIERDRLTAILTAQKKREVAGRILTPDPQPDTTNVEVQTTEKERDREDTHLAAPPTDPLDQWRAELEASLRETAERQIRQRISAVADTRRASMEIELREEARIYREKQKQEREKEREPVESERSDHHPPFGLAGEDAAVASLQSQLASLQRQIDAAVKREADEEAECENLRIARRTEERRREALKTEVAALDAKVQSAQATLFDLQAALAARDTAAARLRSEIDEIKREVAVESAEKQKALRRAEAATAALTVEQAKAEESRRSLGLEMDTLRASLSRAAERSLSLTQRESGSGRGFLDEQPGDAEDGFLLSSEKILGRLTEMETRFNRTGALSLYTPLTVPGRSEDNEAADRGGFLLTHRVEVDEDVGAPPPPTASFLETQMTPRDDSTLPSLTLTATQTRSASLMKHPHSPSASPLPPGTSKSAPSPIALTPTPASKVLFASQSKAAAEEEKGQEDRRRAELKVLRGHLEAEWQTWRSALLDSLRSMGDGRDQSPESREKSRRTLREQKEILDLQTAQLNEEMRALRRPSRSAASPLPGALQGEGVREGEGGGVEGGTGDLVSPSETERGNTPGVRLNLPPLNMLSSASLLPPSLRSGGRGMGGTLDTGAESDALAAIRAAYSGGTPQAVVGLNGSVPSLLLYDERGTPRTFFFSPEWRSLETYRQDPNDLTGLSPSLHLNKGFPLRRCLRGGPLRGGDEEEDLRESGLSLRGRNRETSGTWLLAPFHSRKGLGKGNPSGATVVPDSLSLMALQHSRWLDRFARQVREGCWLRC
uniref:WW domain-containing protein n=1 Tax=Chromera velia CCMP2878 TaxID=1169474 RepID=A0A0G4I1P3_9ALVE|eukprot:Cvel_1673.t1-p1 / transcript=Cvel_1673.t1 / gene=Cvel_1673 / organism=Chromera_velia_CCMP2878 / gene_product=Centrosomal protein of 164 kDa, putative / transcript_product=Centrosomal protein of 164 kDa, putative / location=Cvel_scaffold60:51671-57033(+) / protein_length=1415 / sequence_SO=supercontig / SO=protein_coding / is_pseudo=false